MPILHDTVVKALGDPNPNVRATARVVMEQILHFNGTSEKIPPDFFEFLQFFKSFWAFWNFLGSCRLRLDAFGCVRMCSDVFGDVRTFSEIFGIFLIS